MVRELENKGEGVAQKGSSSTLPQAAQEHEKSDPPKATRPAGTAGTAL